MLEQSEDEEGEDQGDEATLIARGLSVLRRVRTKLEGDDFGADSLDVPTQVSRLIAEARSSSRLCQLYIGWCPWW